MNAMPPFALTSEPISNLTRLDCSDLENVKDARHRLRRCRTEREFADWAATWGEKLCGRAEDMAGSEPGDDMALAEAEAEANRAEKALEDLEQVVRKAVKDLDAAHDGPADKLQGTILDVSANLENAL